MLQAVIFYKDKYVSMELKGDPDQDLVDRWLTVVYLSAQDRNVTSIMFNYRNDGKGAKVLHNIAEFVPDEINRLVGSSISLLGAAQYNQPAKLFFEEMCDALYYLNSFKEPHCSQELRVAWFNHVRSN